MTKRTRDYSQLLIIAAILVTVARYVGAFLASDMGVITGWMSDLMTALMAVTGLGMGFLDVLGSAYVFEGWRAHLPGVDKKWSNRFKVQTVFILALFVSGVGILVPFTVSRVSQGTMTAVLGNGWALWAWAILVNVAPYLLIGGVVTSQAGVVGIATQPTQPKPQPVAQPVAQSATKADALRNLFTATPEARNWNATQVAEAVGCSRQYVERVARKNGNGWEML